MLACDLSAGAIMIDDMETTFAVLFPIYPTAWWKLPLENSFRTHQVLTQTSSGNFSPFFILILHLAGFLMNVFLHIVHEVFLRETFKGEYRICGVMRTHTTDDGCPCIGQFQHFCLLSLFCREGSGGKKWVNKRPGEMGWTPEIQVGTGAVVSHYTETVPQARKRPSLCWEVVLWGT